MCVLDLQLTKNSYFVMVKLKLNKFHQTTNRGNLEKSPTSTRSARVGDLLFQVF